MQGQIGKIWENETKDQKKYHVVEIGGEKYSVWDTGLLEGLAEGATVEYDWQKSGNFRKITDIRVIDPNPDLGPYYPNRKSVEIVRMSCLKSASEILHGLYIDPDTKARKAIDIARDFESYVAGRGKEYGDAGKQA